MEKKVLVTGFNGEIGSKIIKELVSLDKQIIAIDVNDSKGKIESVKYIKDSILNYDLIKSIFENNRITEVYHFAAILSQSATKNPELSIKVNEEASKNLIDFAFQNAVERNFLCKFFFPSSIAVYGPRKIKFASEQDIIKPSTIYGNSKLLIEQYGSKIHEKSKSINSGVDFRSIRFPGVISFDTIPSGGTTDYAPQMIHSALKNQHFDCKLSPQTNLPFISINKAIYSIIKLMNVKKIDSTLRVFNIQEINFTAKDLSDILKEKFPIFTVSFNKDKNFQSVADTWPSSLNCNMFKKYWDFQTEVHLKEFIEKIIEKVK